jgi:CDP-diacylglycerol--glycerol-3-phosphate 3-phosphatidyltransferase
MSTPQANGFYGSKGISGRIPEGYTFLEKLFMKAVHKAGRIWREGDDNDSGSGVQLNEWERHGWTYHAKGKFIFFPHCSRIKFTLFKGIWLSPSPDTAPILTLFGSTNLNSRSAHLDTELSFFMITASPVLRERLREEVRGLRAFTAPWRGAVRTVRSGTRFLVGLVGRML